VVDDVAKRYPFLDIWILKHRPRDEAGDPEACGRHWTDGVIESCDQEFIPLPDLVGVVHRPWNVMVSRGSGQHHRNSKIPAYGAGTVYRLVGSVGVVLDRHRTALSGQCLKMGTVDVLTGGLCRCVVQRLNPRHVMKTELSV